MPSFPFCLFRVSGESMEPTYRSGDMLLGLRWFSPKPGQIVVAMVNHRLLVKRIVSMDATSVMLIGDNPTRSTDSRNFGALPRGVLKAKIIAKL